MTFNPDEARDYHGRWTGGGAPDAGGPTPFQLDAIKIENARREQLAARAAAEKLGYDPNKVIVTTDERTFMLNGQQMNYAGEAELETGRIRLYSNQIMPSQIENIMAHEVEHQKFQTYVNDYQAEAAAMRAATAGIDRGKTAGSDPVMNFDGTLKEPYASQYPLYQEYTRLTADHAGMVKEDGVTDYSRQWWEAWNKGKARTDQAFHETLAEMASLRQRNGPNTVILHSATGSTGPSQPSAKWAALYDAVDRHWKARK